MPRVFIGLAYSASLPYAERYRAIHKQLPSIGWSGLLPLVDMRGGILLDSIGGMIGAVDRTIFDISVPNGNVWLEIGISAGLRKAIFLATDHDPSSQPDLFRSSFLGHYTADADASAKVLTFLQEADPNSLVGPPAVMVPRTAALVGGGQRVDRIAKRIASAGWTVMRYPPNSIKSIADAVRAAEAAEAVVIVRPAGNLDWLNAAAAGALVMLGAAWSLHRSVVLAAGEGEPIPSDCPQVTVRASDNAALATKVIASLNPYQPVPVSGTVRPTLPKGIDRKIAKSVAAALETSGAVYIDAGPGYGKTTTASQAADRTGGPVAWVTVTASLSLPDLIEKLVVAISPLAAGFGLRTMLAARTDVPAIGDAASGSIPRIQPEALAEMATRDDLITPVATGISLVVDNAHLLTDEGSRFISALISSRPTWLHVLCAGRGVVSSLRQKVADASIPCFRSPDLEFDAYEARQLLGLTVPTLPDEHVDFLLRVTAGWVAALAVARLWLTVHPGISLADLKAKAGGDRQDIYRIFATEYFESLPEDIKRDLLLLAVPQTVSAEEALQLLGANGGIRLRQLGDGPYFLTEEDAGRFRYHPLFREFLGQWWTETSGGDTLRQKRGDMAAWYLSRSAHAEAFALAVEAGDWDIAVQAIQPIAQILGSSGDASLALSIIDRLPVGRIKSSRSIWQSWVQSLVLSGDPRARAQVIELAESPGTNLERGMAQMVLLDFRYQMGELNDEAMATAADTVAASLSDSEPHLSIQARYQALSARVVHSADVAAWPALLTEARALADAAEQAGVLSIAAMSTSVAGDLRHRLAEAERTASLHNLRMRNDLGQTISMRERIRAAKTVIESHNESSQLFRRAQGLAEKSGSKVSEAIVALDFARAQAHYLGNQAFVDDAPPDQETVKSAIGLALWAADVFGERGMLRNVALAYKVAAEVALAAGDSESRDKFCNAALKIAEAVDIGEVKQTIERIAKQESPRDVARRGPHPLHEWSPSDRNHLIQETVRVSGATPEQAIVGRGVLDRMVEDDAAADQLKVSVCKHICLLSDLGVPSVGGLPLQQPMRFPVCRLRGTNYLARSLNGKAVLDGFVRDICQSCPEPDPAKTDEEVRVAVGESIYKPLEDRIRSMGSG
jgi:hypothetical protein